MNVAIVGATATGKTKLAVDLARRHSGIELVSVDAMAVYRGLDIGTAKPDRSERDGLSWHLVDVVPPATEFSVATFQQMARDAIASIEGRGDHVVLVGGTGLYHRAVIDELEIPPSFPDIRAELEEESSAGEGAVRSMYERLAALDAVAASRIEPMNTRRVVRALEVVLGSGRPFSSFGPGLLSFPPSKWITIGLSLGRPSLDAAIEARLDQQLSAGFVEEVAGLLARPGGLSRTARQALGYRELIDHLGGRSNFSSTREEILRRTRLFARRQESWFGRDPRVIWFEATRPDLVDVVLARTEFDRF